MGWRLYHDSSGRKIFYRHFQGSPEDRWGKCWWIALTFMRFSQHIKAIKWNEQRLAIAISRRQAVRVSYMYLYSNQCTTILRGEPVAHGVGLSASLHSSAAAVRQQLSDTHHIPYHQQNHHHHRNHHPHLKDLHDSAMMMMTTVRLLFIWLGRLLIASISDCQLAKTEAGGGAASRISYAYEYSHFWRAYTVCRSTFDWSASPDTRHPHPNLASSLSSSFHYEKATNTW